MNCKVCFNHFDHSIRRPFVLSCQHTFCVSCINKLKSTKCPSCNMSITNKNLNTSLLEFLSESTYDKLKSKLLETLNEINEIKNEIPNKRQAIFNENLSTLKEIKDRINSEIDQFLDLVYSNKTKLLNEIIEIENELKKEMSQSNLEMEILEKVIVTKPLVENNTWDEEQLKKLADERLNMKMQIEQISDKIESFKENFEFLVYDCVQIKDGVIGEIKTNQKVY